jgi:TP901 family phage tail tape measure protein
MANFSIAYQFKAMTGQFQSAVKQMKSDMAAFNRQIKINNASAKKLAKNLNAAGKSMTRNLTVPLVAAGTAGVFAFAKLEKGLINTINLLEDREIEQFGDQLKSAQTEAIKMGFSISDVNKGLFDTISALGLSNNSLAAYKQAQVLAIAGNTNLAASVNGITSIVNAYGRATTNATEVSNALFSAQVKGKVTVEELASNIGKVAPMAKQAGVGFKEALAGLSAMTLGGLSAEISATALRATLQTLLKPTKESQKLLKQWGVPVGASGIKAAGLSKTLALVNKAMKENGDEFAKAFPNIRAFIGAATLTDDKLKILDDTVTKINQDIKNGTGLQKGYNRMIKTASQELARLKGRFTLLLNDLGQQLFPILKKIIDNALIPALKWFRALDPATKKWIVRIGVLVAALGPLLFIVGKLITTFIAVKVAVVAIMPAILALGGAAGLGLLLTSAIAIGTAFAGWGIGRLIGQIPIVDKALNAWFGFATGATAAAERAKGLKTLAKAREELIPLLKEQAKVQGFTGTLSKVFLAPKTMEEIQGLKQQLTAGTFKLAETTGATAQQIQGKIVIETRDPQGVIKNVETDTNNKGYANTGVSMITAPTGYFD